MKEIVSKLNNYRTFDVSDLTKDQLSVKCKAYWSKYPNGWLQIRKPNLNKVLIVCKC